MGAFGWRIPALPYSLHELMTGEPKIRFPKATQPDKDGWWPAAQWDTPGGLGDLSALPSLKDVGITHPPSAKMARPKVSVLKDDQVELVDPPAAPRAPKPSAALASAAANTIHPPMAVTPVTADAPVGKAGDTKAPEEPVADKTGAIKVAFTKEESEAILRKTPPDDDTPSQTAAALPTERPGDGASADAVPVEPAIDAKAGVSHDAGTPEEPAVALAEPSTTPGTAGQPASTTQTSPDATPDVPAVITPEPAAPADATMTPPARPAEVPNRARDEVQPTPNRATTHAQPEPESTFVFDPKTMPISPPAPSIPGDDTDSLIVESFTEADDDLAYASPFSTVPPTSGRRWGQTAKERRQAKRYQQAIERNLDNAHAPLDVLFAQDRRAKPRRMALRPSVGRDLLVWLIAIVGVGQMLYRAWEILPTLNTFNTNISDFQIIAAMSLMVGGAVSAVLALVAVRFITGMRSAVAWMASIFLVFGVFPWYGFGSQLSPTGLPPLPKPIDVVFNPVFDQNGLLGITLIGLAFCAIVATLTAFIVGVPKRG